MKKILLSCIALGSFLALTVGACGVDDATDGATEDAIDGSAAQTAETSSAVQTAASGHWYLVSTRNCLADFNQVCSDTVPTRQCADDPNPGSSCPSVGAGCNRVLGSLGYQVLKCIP